MNIEVSKIKDWEDKMLQGLRKGKEKGETTHIPQIDEAWTWKLGEANIWSGYANEGKSTLLKILCIIKYLEDDWRFIFCSPEDWPPYEFYDDLIHTLAGINTDLDRKERSGLVTEKLYKEIINKIKDAIIFLYVKPPNNTLKKVLDEGKKLIEKDPKIKGFVMDPLIKFKRPQGEDGAKDDRYAANITTLLTDYARENKQSIHLVMHQLTPRLNEEGLYPKPSPYNIKGGGTWNDGIDNMLTVWRPKFAKDKKDTTVIFSSGKIKKQKLIGIPQDVALVFDRKKNRYTLPNGLPIYDFDKHFQKEKPYFQKNNI